MSEALANVPMYVLVGLMIVCCLPVFILLLPFFLIGLACKRWIPASEREEGL